MTAGEHTASPWVMMGGLGHGLLVSGLHGEPICVVYGPRSNPRSQQDADLIAAAPVMLAAIKALMLPLRAALEDGCRVDPAHMLGAMRAADMAILAAEGAPVQMDNPFDGRGAGRPA